MRDAKGFILDIEEINHYTLADLILFEKNLKLHPNYDVIKNNFIIDKERKILIHILQIIPASEVSDLTDEQITFYPLCNKSEIERIFNPKNAYDFLLKHRAEQVIDTMRLRRVFISIMNQDRPNWNFSKHFDTKSFYIYLNTLPTDKQTVCKTIPCGTIYIKDANGYCMKSPFGNIVVISFALKRFLYYMNLFYYGEEPEIPSHDCFEALVIATRIMLGKESLDFEIDSRGEIPKKTHELIQNYTDWQMLFIAGHEYAHHYLNHLLDASIGKLSVHTSELNEKSKFYTFSQQNELDADYASVMSPNITDEDRSSLANSAFYFFFWLEIYETVEHYFHPPTYKPRTHPLPLNRVDELRAKLDSKYGVSKEFLDNEKEKIIGYKNELITNILPFETDIFEFTGSAYLSSSRGAVKIDRIHF